MRFEAGFKKPGPGKIVWSWCDAVDFNEARQKLNSYLEQYNARIKKSGIYLFYAGPLEVKTKGTF